MNVNIEIDTCGQEQNQGEPFWKLVPNYQNQI